MKAAAPELPLRDRILLSLALYACVLAAYFAAGSVSLPPLYRVRTPLDNLIPFVPRAMLAYGLVYVVPISGLWLARDEASVRRMMRAVLLAYALAAPFFVAFPVQDADPPLVGTSWSEQLLGVNRLTNQTKNAFPSMHVGLATLLTLIGFRRSRRWGLALTGASVVIVAATLLVKQHFVVDLPAGAVIGWLAFRTVYGDDEPA